MDHLAADCSRFSALTLHEGPKDNQTILEDEARKWTGVAASPKSTCASYEAAAAFGAGTTLVPVAETAACSGHHSQGVGQSSLVERLVQQHPKPPMLMRLWRRCHSVAEAMALTCSPWSPNGHRLAWLQSHPGGYAALLLRSRPPVLTRTRAKSRSQPKAQLHRSQGGVAHEPLPAQIPRR
mmetsp:Transcript_11469/g.18741  ORF Transcript_11469/g.18741 Transcript_11469/m.18741 type:complete len:181 (+) Transcript_11469:76-618(+)